MNLRFSYNKNALSQSEKYNKCLNNFNCYFSKLELQMRAQ